MQVFALAIFLSALTYIIVVFGLSRLAIPNLQKVKPQKNVPQQLAQLVDTLNQTKKDENQFVGALCKVVAQRFHSKRAKMFLYPRRFFVVNISEMWGAPGTQPCHIWNVVLASALVYSGRFRENDIKTKHTVVNGCIHQYLQLQLPNGQALDVDAWGYGIGKTPLGKHAHGFI